MLYWKKIGQGRCHHSHTWRDDDYCVDDNDDEEKEEEEYDYDIDDDNDDDGDDHEF